MFRWFFRLTELAIVSLILISLVLTMGALYIRLPGPLPADKIVVIEAGQSVRQIAEQLVAENIIRPPKEIFLAALLLTRQYSILKAGEYQFYANESLLSVMRRMVVGAVVIHKITVVEGSTVYQILKTIGEDSLMTGPLPGNVREGSLLPNTYYYNRGDSRAGLISRMQTDFNNAVKEAWNGRSKDLPPAISTPDAMVTLASIIEKETSLAIERDRIAGVFANRLKLGMPLQSDPTTIYALTNGKGGPLGRSLTLSDLQNTQSPYNTYVVQGLPPAPICNPSRASLRAAAYPEANEYLYFVANGQGGHTFSKDLSTHNRNVMEWRRIRNLKREQDERDHIKPSESDQMIEDSALH